MTQRQIFRERNILPGPGPLFGPALGQEEAFKGRRRPYAVDCLGQTGSAIFVSFIYSFLLKGISSLL